MLEKKNRQHLLIKQQVATRSLQDQYPKLSQKYIHHTSKCMIILYCRFAAPGQDWPIHVLCIQICSTNGWMDEHGALFHVHRIFRYRKGQLMFAERNKVKITSMASNEEI
jgi:hypothetical protein